MCYVGKRIAKNDYIIKIIIKYYVLIRYSFDIIGNFNVSHSLHYPNPINNAF